MSIWSRTAESRFVENPAIDRPGCGLTDGALPTMSTVRQQSVAFLEQALDGLGLECPAFLASSVGSLWSIWLALDRPQRVAAAVHVGTPALILETSAPYPMRLMSIPPLGRLLMALQPPSPRRVDQTAAMVNVDLFKEPEVRQMMVESEKMPDAAASFIALLHACVRLRGARPQVALTAEQLAELDHPVQLIWADDDPFGEVAVGQRAAETIPDAELHVIPGGHAPWVNTPQQVGRLATTFLRQHFASQIRRATTPAQPQFKGA